MRAFVAIEVPDAVKAGMETVQSLLKSSGVEAAWSRPAGIHLTLKFLGETAEGLVPQIMAALARALSATERFRLCIEGVGAFPNPASARVVWLGVTGGAGRLAVLQSAVESALVEVGLERDARLYTPHLTLGRIRHIRRRDVWLKRLEALGNVKLPGFDVTAVSLIESERRPAGAVYRELGRVVLQGGPG